MTDTIEKLVYEAEHASSVGNHLLAGALRSQANSLRVNEILAAEEEKD